ncbi:unnamed protein product [Meloidogyne enterolobii]|uniref:Uncharacterized protein n=1 Tax=Meloidogyne enterolobii TaxID=390850 RepID=A0ACB0XT60_MELEN
MEYILWNRKEFDIIYNCTGINVDDIPIEKRRYPIAAIICILLGFIYYVRNLKKMFFLNLKFKPIYFPCLYSFWKNRNKNPCYKLLIYLSILDIGILWLPTFSAGIFSLNGVVYCTSPISTYVVGCACLCKFILSCQLSSFGFTKILNIYFAKIFA